MFTRKIQYAIIKQVTIKKSVYCENGKYLASIMDDSVVTCDEIHRVI